jgi:uncharacterized protein
MPSKNKKNTRQAESNKKKRGSWLLLLLFVPIIAGIIISIMPRPTSKVSGPQFRKEGELKFLSSEKGSTLALIDIELADDDVSRTRGLMWRKAMQEDQGMLFIMEQTEIQSFWMLNTYISLDIIFVDEDLRIVTIRPDTEPQSLKPVASNEAARYVVEVNAGFCAKYGITTGDRIEFNLLPQ